MVFILALAKIMLVNIVLSGDNAVVIALAGRSLPKRQQTLAILWGCAGAVVLRVLLTLVAVFLLSIPYLQAVGGLLLIWIAAKLLNEPDDDEEEIKSNGTLLAAIRTIIIADIVMSLDNTLAIAAIAENDYLLLTLGLALSVPIIVFGSKFIMWLMERFPVIVYIGAGLICWTAGEMLVRDDRVRELLNILLQRGILSEHVLQALGLAVPVTATIGVLLPCWLLNRRKQQRMKAGGVRS